MDTHIIAVYGSLKEGFWNYEHFLSDQERLGDSEVRGVMQLAGGGYPYLFKDSIIPTEQKDYPIEIYRVSEDIYKRITGMELASGYYLSTIDTEYGEASIYYAEERMFNKEKEIINEYSLELHG